MERGGGHRCSAGRGRKAYTRAKAEQYVFARRDHRDGQLLVAEEVHFTVAAGIPEIERAVMSSVRLAPGCPALLADANVLETTDTEIVVAYGSTVPPELHRVPRTAPGRSRRHGRGVGHPQPDPAGRCHRRRECHAPPAGGRRDSPAHPRPGSPPHDPPPARPDPVRDLTRTARRAVPAPPYGPTAAPWAPPDIPGGVPRHVHRIPPR